MGFIYFFHSCFEQIPGQTDQTSWRTCCWTLENWSERRSVGDGGALCIGFSGASGSDLRCSGTAPGSSGFGVVKFVRWECAWRADSSAETRSLSSAMISASLPRCGQLVVFSLLLWSAGIATVRCASRETFLSRGGGGGGGGGWSSALTASLCSQAPLCLRAARSSAGCARTVRTGGGVRGSESETEEKEMLLARRSSKVGSKGGSETASAKTRCEVGPASHPQ